MCGFDRALDSETAHELVAGDARFRFDSEADEISCAHCWTVLYGATARARYLVEHQQAIDQQLKQR